MRTKLKEIFNGSKYSGESEAIADMIINHLTGISVMSKFVKDPKRFDRSNEIFLRALSSK